MPHITLPAIFGVFVAILLTIGIGMYGCPRYAVYSAEKDGEAAYARAEQDRQIVVRQALAKRDAAVLEAQAEVERAKGLAQANTILGQSLQGEEGAAYLRYLWIQKMEEGGGRTVVYVPTETNLPLFLESGRGAK
jgi:regulator of protease activity HflC (stomatin/prohibitin superfamily)